MARDVSGLGEDGIEAEIRKLNFELQTKSFSLKEEKALMKLRRSLNEFTPEHPPINNRIKSIGLQELKMRISRFP